LQSALQGELAEEAAQPPIGDAAIDESIAAKWDSLLGAARKRIDEESTKGQGLPPALLTDGLVALAGEVPALGTATAEMDAVRFAIVRVAFIHQPHHKSVGAALKHLTASKEKVLAVRERWREFPPTWKTTLQLAADFGARPGAAWHWLGRDDAARLLALADLLKDAKSLDIPGPDGKAIEPPRVSKWVRAALKLAEWDIARAIAGERPEAAAPPPAATVPAAPQRGARSAVEVLRTLRVASLERIVRELSRPGAAVTRAAVRAELDAAPQARWIGDAIVCWPEP
jgi:hypothetical protein